MDDQEDVISGTVLTRALSGLTGVIMQNYDPDFYPQILGKNVEETKAAFDERYGTSFCKEAGLRAAHFFYSVCLAVAHRRGDVLLTREGRERLGISQRPSGKTPPDQPIQSEGE